MSGTAARRLVAAFLVAAAAWGAGPSRVRAQETLLLQEGVAGYSGTSDVSIFAELPGNASGVDPVLYVGMTQFGDARRAFLRFDLETAAASGALPADATIEAVDLRLVVERSRGTTDVHALTRVTRAWAEGPARPEDPGAGGMGEPAVEGDVTWSHARWPATVWTSGGGDVAAVGASATAIVAGAGSEAVFGGPGLVADVEAWRADPATNLGWRLDGDESGNFNARRFHSGEAATASLRPRLAITFRRPVAASVAVVR